MNKNNESVNVLIKRKGLIEELNSIGINRISKDAEKLLFAYLNLQSLQLFLRIKEEMEVQGKRIFDKDIFEKVINSINGEKSIDY